MGRAIHNRLGSKRWTFILPQESCLTEHLGGTKTGKIQIAKEDECVHHLKESEATYRLRQGVTWSGPCNSLLGLKSSSIDRAGLCNSILSGCFARTLCHYLLEPLLPTLPIRHHPRQQFEEGCAVMRLSDVAKFVGDDIVNGVNWSFDETSVQQETMCG